MIRLLTIAVLIAAFTCAGAGAADGPENPNWQLVFRYDGPGLELVKADRIVRLDKQVRTPGLIGAPVVLDYRFEWRDASGHVQEAGETQIPLGIRATLGENEPCLPVVPPEGVVVIRIKGPAESQLPAEFRLARIGLATKARSDLSPPAAFETDSWTFPVPSQTALNVPEEGPLGVEKIRDTGPDQNRLVVVVLGDGYIATELASGVFVSAAAGLGSSIESKPPWDVLFSATNLYRIDVESNESGADNEVYGVMKDTYFNASFWVNEIERLLALTGDGGLNAVNAADMFVGPGVWDILLVLVNSTKYGGSGGYIAVSSVHSASSEIILHELGHSFAHLADEYETPYPGYPPGDPEPNVDFDYEGPGLKWLVWVGPGVPLPTPDDTPAWDGFCGAFEGARYLSTGIYRPWYNCEMRSLDRPFCPVCGEAHVMEFCDMIALVDELDPPAGSAETVDLSGVEFTATPLSFPNLTYGWTLDGVPLAGGDGPSLTLTSDQMAGGTQTLVLEITFDTDLVRKTTISEGYSWPVTQGSLTCCTGIVGDANNSGGYDPTIGDVTALIDHLFISQEPLECYFEADINQSGGPLPTAQDITIGDVTLLIDHLFINETPLADCL